MQALCNGAIKKNPADARRGSKLEVWRAGHGGSLCPARV